MSPLFRRRRTFPFGQSPRRNARTSRRGTGTTPVVFDPDSYLAWTFGSWAGDPDWTPPADGGQVTELRDSIRTLLPLTSAAGTGSGAVYRAAVAEANNRPAIDFDGASAIANLTTPALSQPHTTVSVVMFDSIAGSQRFFGGATAGNGRSLGKAAGGGWVMDYTTADTGTDAGQNPQVGIVYVIRADGGGASSSFEVNGQMIAGIDSVGTSGINQLVWGSGRTNAPAFANFFNGKKFLHYGGPTANVAAVWPQLRADLAAYFGAPLV